MPRPKWFQTSMRRFSDFHFSHMGSIERSLQPISSAIRDSCQAIANAEVNGDVETWESVVDEETEIVEHLLGVSFVLCQIQLTYIVSAICELNAYCDKQQKPWNRFQKKNRRAEILQYNGLYAVDPRIMIIEHSANYFKHQHEWDRDWDYYLNQANCSDPRICQRAEIIGTLISIGARQYSSGNLRTVAKHMGNSEYYNLDVFIDILNKWSSNVYAGCEAEMKSLGII